MKTLLKIIILLAYTLPFCFFMLACDKKRGFPNKDKYFEYKKSPSFNFNEDTIVVDVTTTTQITTDTVSSLSQPPTQTTTDTVSSLSQPPTQTTTSENADLKLTSIGENILFVVWFITIFSLEEESISGFGLIIYFPSLIGQTTIGLTLLCSLLLFFEKKLQHTWFKAPHLYLFNILGLSLFIVQSFILSIDLKWGIIVVILLNGTGLYQSRSRGKEENL